VCELSGFVWLNVGQRCTNTGRQVAVATKFLRWFIISVDLQYGTGVMSLAPRILRCFTDFWTICAALGWEPVAAFYKH
jgi:hypothetical protein